MSAEQVKESMRLLREFFHGEHFGDRRTEAEISCIKCCDLIFTKQAGSHARAFFKAHAGHATRIQCGGCCRTPCKCITDEEWEAIRDRDG